MSGLAPLIGIAVFKMLFTTKPDLADLKTVHFFALGTLCAASNAAFVNLYYTMSGRLAQPLDLIMTIFIGDIVGTVIVLSLLSFVLTLFISRRRA
jgi:fructose-specific phosphotransferase system IIC component